MKKYSLHFFKLLYVKFNYHDILAKSAEITYYLFFSIFPLMLLILSLLPLINIDPVFLLNLIEDNFASELITPITYFIDYLISNPSSSALGIGIVLTLFSASSATNALIKNLNKIYEVNLTRSFFRFRLIAVISTILLLVIFFTTIILYSMTSDFFIQFLNPTLALYLSKFKEFVLPLFFVGILGFLYVVAPVTTNYGFQVIPGVIFSIIMFNIINNGILIYLSLFSSIALTYGTIASIIIFMLYMYLISTVVLFGGLINSTLMDLKTIKLAKLNNSDLRFEVVYEELISCYIQNDTNVAPKSKSIIHKKK